MRSCPLAFLLLVLLHVTGCTTVSSDASLADGRPQGVRGPAVTDRPVGPSPTPPMAQPSGESALVRTEPDRSHHKPKRDLDRALERHVEAPPQRPRAEAAPQRPAPRVRPAAPQHRMHPRVRPRSTPQQSVPKAPQVRPQPRVGPEQMRDLCRRADGVASHEIVGLCRQTWG